MRSYCKMRSKFQRWKSGKEKKEEKNGEPRTNILQNVKDVSRANILKKKKMPEVKRNNRKYRIENDEKFPERKNTCFHIE